MSAVDIPGAGASRPQGCQHCGVVVSQVCVSLKLRQLTHNLRFGSSMTLWLQLTDSCAFVVHAGVLRPLRRRNLTAPHAILPGSEHLADLTAQASG